MRLYLYIILLMGTLSGCSLGQSRPEPTARPVTTAFMQQYQPYCGQTFFGLSTYTDLGDDSPLKDARLTMTIESCSEVEIRIRFIVNEDSSRTWILGYLEEGLRLAHDHRNADGSYYEANFYGGIAMNKNNAFRYYPTDGRPSASTLFFPADARTLMDRPAREVNVWSKSFDIPAQRYYYRLYLSGELRYEATFILEENAEMPAAVSPEITPQQTSAQNAFETESAVSPSVNTNSEE
jgi:hypothetical protein